MVGQHCTGKSCSATTGSRWCACSSQPARHLMCAAEPTAKRRCNTLDDLEGRALRLSLPRRKAVQHRNPKHSIGRQRFGGHSQFSRGLLLRRRLHLSCRRHFLSAPRCDAAASTRAADAARAWRASAHVSMRMRASWTAPSSPRDIAQPLRTAGRARALDALVSVRTTAPRP